MTPSADRFIVEHKVHLMHTANVITPQPHWQQHCLPRTKHAISWQRYSCYFCKVHVFFAMIDMVYAVLLNFSIPHLVGVWIPVIQLEYRENVLTTIKKNLI